MQLLILVSNSKALSPAKEALLMLRLRELISKGSQRLVLRLTHESCYSTAENLKTALGDYLEPKDIWVPKVNKIQGVISASNWINNLIGQEPIIVITSLEISDILRELKIKTLTSLLCVVCDLENEEILFSVEKDETHTKTTDQPLAEYRLTKM